MKRLREEDEGKQSQKLHNICKKFINTTVTDSGSDGIVDYLSPHRHKSCKPASHKLNKCKCRRSKVNIRTWMFWHDHETVLIEYAICCETCKRQSHPAYDISLAIQDWNEMNKKREE